MDLRIPTSENIDADWFSAALQQAGIDATVVAFSAEQVGTGQIGKCVRYQLNYAHDVAEAPASVVVKYPSDDPTSRATGVMLRNFLKEVRFYQELQSQLSIPTPKCYYAEIIDEGPDFAVMMQDLAPASQGDQLQGCSPEIAEAAVLALVGLHAPSWCDSSLQERGWLGNAEIVSTDAMKEMYRSQLPGFIERYGHSLDADEKGIIERVGHVDDAPLFANFPEMFSLVHVDYRLDNLLLHERPHGYDITVVDWQSITLGAPLNDVAYFLGAGLLPEVRVEYEERIVRKYHAALRDAGVDDLSWDACWLAYRRGVFAGFGVTVVASMLVQQTARGDQMFTAMAKRHARHALDLNGDEFLR